MHLYNSTDQIQKYDSISEIINEFYDVRLDLYEKRKAHIEDFLQKELDIIEARVKFIKDYISDTIIIKNVPVKELCKRMVELNYPKFDLSHNKGEPMYSPSYDYLLRMQLYTLTRERIDELLKQCKNKQMELATIKGKTPQDLWIDDLDEFVKVYKKLYAKPKTIKVKETVTKTKRKRKVKVKAPTVKMV
tara:strand:+ start:34 stop:603 length:570 start_codon:yes stop_codon:yes gene_type:complete